LLATHVSSCPHTESAYILPLSLHDALPIFFITIAPVNDPPVIVSLEATILTVNAGEGPVQISTEFEVKDVDNELLTGAEIGFRRDRKSTRLNSSHVKISYAVFCLNKNSNHE